ncbi:MAG TPA: glucosamine-6-phosphate deaminase [Ruminococcaceae bacterium]|nr:glucosamine-6-phosphate deaminase [Oscillospiraceae bacterium]
MKVIKLDNAAQIGEQLGRFYVDYVKANPSCVLGLATGATPVPTYNYIAKAYAAGEVSLADVKTFNLDEYCDLPKDNKNSYYTFMHENLFNHTDIKEENVNFLDGNASDYDAESKRYAEAIKAAGGIDVQILGIGRNGHIAFNEPSDAFTNEAFRVALTQSTIDANSIYFDDAPMPHYAMTMGIGSIMRSKKIVLVATGASKADAVKGMIEGEVTPQLPASILQQHPDVTVYLDKEAASLLK